MKPQDPLSKTAAAAIHTNGTTTGALPPVAPPVPPPPALSSPPSLETVWHIVCRRWLTICCLGLVAAGVGFAAFWQLFPGKYTATRTLRIAKANRGAYESEEAFSSFVRAQAALVKSPDVIRKVLDQTTIQELHEIQSNGDAKQWLQDKIVTDTQLSPEILRISLSGDNPEELAVILDELIRQILKEYKTREDARALDRSDQLLGNYKKTAETLREKRIVLATKLQEAGIEDPQTITIKQNSLYTNILANETERVKLRREEAADRFTLATMKESLEKPESIVVSQATIDDKMKDEPLLKPFYDEVAAIDKKIAETARVAPTSPLISQYKNEREEAVKRLRSHVDQFGASVEEKLRRKAVDELRDNLAKLGAKLKSYGMQKEILDGEIAARQAEIGKLKLAVQANERSTNGVASLMDEVSQTELVLKRIGEELGNIQIDNSTGSRVEVLDKKNVPTARKTDTQTKYAGVAGLSLLGMVFFGVVFWEYGHRRVYTANDVTRGLNLPVLGTLPPVSATARQGVSAANPAPPAANKAP